jgi:Leucine-rich repeat (LRR) protein
LTLNENPFVGSIPEEWSSLSDLFLLGLSNNFLTGPIPQWIAGLSSLTTFSVYGNMLTGTIPVGDYSALSGFSVGRNDLTQGPFPQFLLGGALKTLLLSYSGLTGRVPEDWTVAPRLFSLDWSRNAMTGTLPTSLGLLQDLWRLGAGFNLHMGTLPSELGNTGLAQLALESNEFTGTIPETYLNLPLGKSMLQVYRMHRCHESVFLSIVEVFSNPRPPL